MTPITALYVIVAISLITTAVGAPFAFAFRAEIKRAQRNISSWAALGLTTSLLGLVSLGLWWYYALATSQVLLAVIPTVSVVWGFIMRAVVAKAKA